MIFLDQLKLKQILINLISNAFKFTHAGKIEVVFNYFDETFLSFRVTDTGIGIPKDKHAEIFERFTQIDHGLTRKYGGTGLGLSIVKGLLELVGGKISMDSVTENLSSGKAGGTTFHFLFPYHTKIIKSIK